MSRIGRLPIALPPHVTVKINENDVTVTGPNGELHRRFHPDMLITIADNTVKVARPTDNRLHRSLHGLTRTLLANMVEGVTKGFDKRLEITGVGYRAELAGDKLMLRLGFSHPTEVSPLPGVSFAVESPTRVKISGRDKEVVGQMAAKIRAIYPPDSYKGKGIRYAGKTVRIKPGKAGKAIGSKQ